MQSVRKSPAHRLVALVSLLTLPAALVVFAASATAAPVAPLTGAHARSGTVTSTSLGQSAPTFAGPAATGCSGPGCSLLTGPFRTPSTASASAQSTAKATAAARRLAASANASDGHQVMPSPTLPRNGPDPAPPSVSCQPMGPGCDPISTSAGGAIGVKGLNAVDSASLTTNPLGDIEPADQGLCAGNGYVVETNNIGEILVFNKDLRRLSAPIPFDTLMGLTGQGWSSGGDPSCLFDQGDGGHWFFTEIVSKTTEASGGPFAGCFAGTANSCLEGIAVSAGSNPFGPYNVYFANADYNPTEPGAPYLLNDFAKISTTRDAFLLFYDEFPLNGNVPGIGGGFFNGAQELAFSKDALEQGLPVAKSNGKPNQKFNVAIENMGLLPTPDGTCASDNLLHRPGIACWYQVIPAVAPDPSQYDNSNGGSGFMLGTLDFYGQSDNRLAVFDWTGLGSLNSSNCNKCAGIQFGGGLFSGVQSYFGEGFLAAQKAGPTPLGDECGAAGLSVGSPPPATCPEGGIATNGDGMTQASQGQGQIYGAISTEIAQTYSSESSPEIHQGVAYWVVGTRSFDNYGVFSLTSQGYVSPEHEDLAFPAIAAVGNSGGQQGDYGGGTGKALMTFTLTGDGGPTGADNGGFYPSTAYGWLTSTSGGLVSPVHVADLGQSPQDGFTEYQGYPGPTRPRWGDYSNAIWSGGQIYFATNYIQYPNCTGSEFTLTIGTCGGTRDGFANWGTSVNSVQP